MAFPTIESSVASNNNAFDTTQEITLPSGIVSGDLLVAFCGGSGNGPHTWPAGWTEIRDFEGTFRDCTVGYREADGTEGSSITVTSTNAGRSVSAAYRISGAEPVATQAPQVSPSTTEGAGATANVPALTPTGGAKDYLWITFVSGSKTDLNTPPTNYGSQISDSNSSGRTSGAHRNLNAASEDPGTWAIGGASSYATLLVAVHPLSALPQSPAARSGGLALKALREGIL